jgi:hypothetical protein
MPAYLKMKNKLLYAVQAEENPNSLLSILLECIISKSINRLSFLLFATSFMKVIMSFVLAIEMRTPIYRIITNKIQFSLI